MNSLEIIASVILWFAVLVRSHLILYAFNSRKMVRILYFAPYLLLAGLALGGYNYFITYQVSWFLIFPVLVYVAILFSLSYTIRSGEFTSLEKAQPLEKIAESEPEMVVVDLSSRSDNQLVHVIPMKYLTAGELILEAKGLPGSRYSLSYCLLCNTAHAYLLPVVEGKEIELSSRGGAVLNGNKVLSDISGRYIWQQFTGEPVAGTQQTLEELELRRLPWHFVKKLYPDAQYYISSIQPLQYRIYKLMGKLVRSISWLKFTAYKDDTLPSKMIVTGVSMLGKGAKAYPMMMFEAGIPSLIEDQIGDTSFSLVFNGMDCLAFGETGLILAGDSIQKDDLSWDLEGNPLGNHDSLTHIPVTANAYWYLWSKFNPETSVY